MFRNYDPETEILFARRRLGDDMADYLPHFMRGYSMLEHQFKLPYNTR